MHDSNMTAETGRGRVAKLALSALLAFSIGAAPLSAFAETEGEAEGAVAEEAAENGADGAVEGAAEVKHALYAAAGQAATANDAAFSTAADVACGLFADAGATIVANALAVQTQGDQSAAVATSGDGGNVSITNSTLATAGGDSPLLFSTGLVEADNVTGSASKSAIACIQGGGTILMAESSLTSSYAGSATDAPSANAVAIYRTDTIDATSSDYTAALFQASGSTLESAVGSGSFFYLTNTTASVILSHTKLSFDSAKAKLLVACGSDTTSNLVTTNGAATTYGTAGKNGATVTFTALGQELAGDIEVDSISSLGFYLLEGSKWTGAAGITSNSTGIDLSSNIIVNIDATSGWTVADDSTVSTLNIEKGGALVDGDGKSVTIVDADGNTLVDGASDVKVTVTDEFSTTVKTTASNALREPAIDRAAFDEEYGTSTAFGTNGSSASAADEERAAELQAIIVEWFENLK